MTPYGLALFIHVVFGILLVGGSAGAHLTTGLLPRARTVDGLRAHVAWMHAFVKAAGPISGVVLLAGLYMAFAGEHWGSGWPAVSLVLFALGGVGAFAVMDPRITRIRDMLEEAEDGPVTPALGEQLADRALTTVAWTLGGADLAIVFLMTNKPGWAGSVVVGVAGLALGAAVAGWELQRHAAPSEPPATAPPMSPA